MGVETFGVFVFSFFFLFIGKERRCVCVFLELNNSEGY